MMNLCAVVFKQKLSRRQSCDMVFILLISFVLICGGLALHLEGQPTVVATSMEELRISAPRVIYRVDDDMQISFGPDVGPSEVVQSILDTWPVGVAQYCNQLSKEGRR